MRAIRAREHDDVGEDLTVCEELAKLLDRDDTRPSAMSWIADGAVKLALSGQGTRVVQKAIEIAGDSERERLVSQLRPHVVVLCDSMHGNYVLAKLVEVLPPSAVGFVAEKLKGREVATAKHRFGCRICERLIEHCADDSQLRAFLDEIVKQTATLCKHKYGNFVVQHLLEHGASDRQAAVLAWLLPEVPLLAAHRTASHVVQRGLDFLGEEGEKDIVLKLLGGAPPHSLEDVACTRYGSFVVEQILVKSSPWAQDQVRVMLTPFLSQLRASQFGPRVADKMQAPGDEAEWAAATENASVLGGG